jgi:hypothetical protein
MAPITRADLARLPSKILSPGRNRTKADVLLVDRNGERVVAKDFRNRGVIVRNTIGRLSVSRECRAYARLAGLSGIPPLIGRVDAYAFAYGFVPGSALPSLKRRSLPASFFRALEALLESIHSRGVAVADLHHRNVIVAEPAGSPAMIDFSLALSRPAAWNLPGRWMFRFAQQLDRLAVQRIRQRYEQAPVTGVAEGVTRPEAGSSSPRTEAEGEPARSYRAGSRAETGAAMREPKRAIEANAALRLYRAGRALKSAIRRLRRRD